MIDAGSITDPKALQRMLGEMESLQRRISDLEDVEIEVMERLEAAQAGLDRHTAELAELDARIAELETARAEKAHALETSMDAVAAERATLVLEVPDDLVALYTKLREQKGGIGASALRRRECGGCRLTLNPSDLAAIAAAPTDEVVRCEECSRILVRTGESGL
jgi:predicted  nucleic acid-binding Zn-ribbon protein